MSASAPADSARRRQLLELAYGYVLDHGLADLSLRPLAEAVGSSPRVLLYLFGSKDGLVRALLTRAREDELRLLDTVRAEPGAHGLAEAGELVWRWLAAPEHRRLLTLWAEGYARSLTDDRGPWADFARRSVDVWLEAFAAAQPPEHRGTPAGTAERTLLLSVLRGALLDLLATGDRPRADAAVAAHLAVLRGAGDRSR
ncbi:MAG TPA: TetR family transcriptional regulator [Streptomyces sp.]|uniref:TetR/AcrR family transcriptional regulator n=1 Tax=Streptomyces sp. TaxID=1931 RepID=UPI002D4331B4|nr:TetR family transcriptional regulator [Streptomyces sp.]HZG06442.1 TetR family transcriptional regulator [Streptomyces sp.]